MPYVFAALTGVFAVAYAFLRRDGGLAGRIFFKCAASVMFVLIAVSVRAGAPEGYYTLILCGLCASLAGDIALLFTDRDKGFLMAGGAAFALAHGLYIAAFWTIASPTWVDAVLLAGLLALGLSLVKNRRNKAGRGSFLLIAYVVLLCATTARAVSMLWVREAPVMFGVTAAAGGVLFAVSDLLLGVEYQTGSKAAGSLSTVAYYSAQALIAFTVMLAP